MWVVRLTDKQLEVLRALLRSEEHLGPALRGVVEALDLARWDELPEAELPWEEIEILARRQNISEARRDLGPVRKADRGLRACCVEEQLGRRSRRVEPRPGSLGRAPEPSCPGTRSRPPPAAGHLAADVIWDLAGKRCES